MKTTNIDSNLISEMNAVSVLDKANKTEKDDRKCWYCNLDMELYFKNCNLCMIGCRRLE